MKTIIICDYPSKYTFPSFGFGSAEKRIWSFLITMSRLKEFNVVATGPLWKKEFLPENVQYFPKRLELETSEEFLNKFGKCDYLFAGHEYFDKPDFIEAFQRVAEKRFSYQGNLYQYSFSCYDAKDTFLFCYSDEMLNLYKEQKPFKVLSYHAGVNEENYLVENPRDYLVWIGRFDFDKSPHYAILAAKILGKQICVLGKPVYQPDYMNEYGHYFSMSHVKVKGEVFGSEKMKLLSEASCGIYTLGPNYTEAGAGVLGEILRSGVPLAAISWKGNDAVCSAVDTPELGKVSVVSKDMTDQEVAERLAEAIKFALERDRQTVYNIAKRKYDRYENAKKMISIVDNKYRNT